MLTIALSTSKRGATRRGTGGRPCCGSVQMRSSGMPRALMSLRPTARSASRFVLVVALMEDRHFAKPREERFELARHDVGDVPDVCGAHVPEAEMSEYLPREILIDRGAVVADLDRAGGGCPNRRERMAGSAVLSRRSRRRRRVRAQETRSVPGSVTRDRAAAPRRLSHHAAISRCGAFHASRARRGVAEERFVGGGDSSRDDVGESPR